MINRFAATAFFLLQVMQAVLASDEMGEIDKARVFPIQKNNTVIHSTPKSGEDVNENQASLTSLGYAKGSPPKDTSLIINGNGGSSNRSAGGNASLRKRFTFN
jgi:beta-lactam-binding protein with PASTA domain